MQKRTGGLHRVHRLGRVLRAGRENGVQQRHVQHAAQFEHTQRLSCQAVRLQVPGGIFINQLHGLGRAAAFFAARAVIIEGDLTARKDGCFQCGEHAFFRRAGAPGRKIHLQPAVAAFLEQPGQLFQRRASHTCGSHGPQGI